MARAGVADFKSDLDEAARGFPDHLLGAGDALARHELQRSHAGRLLEDMGEMRGTEFHQLGEAIDGDFLREILSNEILHFAELPKWKPAAVCRNLPCGL